MANIPSLKVSNKGIIMKKSILVLSVLLFLLILTCVYQNTYRLYEKYHSSTSNTLNTVTPVSLLKKEISEIKVPKQEVILPKSVKPAIVSSVISSKKTEPEILEKDIPDSKIKIEDTDTFPHKQETEIIFAKKKDLEEIDSLLQALKNRDIALQYRDELILRIQELIKQVLDNRTTTIDQMNNEEEHLLQLHEELLKTRDIAYDKIGQSTISTSGKQ
jgi:vacuolar-type H+-ATPase subunit I/STV1